jgi:hypothetical protein
MCRLIATIEVIGRALGQPSDPLKQILLLEYGKIIQKSNGSMSYDEYFVIARHFLLFGCDDNHPTYLQMLFNESPFANPDEPHSPHLCSPTASFSPFSPRVRRWRARHSLRPDSILLHNEEHYSPSLAQQALAVLNPPRPIRDLVVHFVLEELL